MTTKTISDNAFEQSALIPSVIRNSERQGRDGPRYPNLYYINNFARDTPWLHPVVAGYAEDGVVLFASFLLAGWWIARRTNNPSAMAAAVWAPLGVLAAVAINQPIADTINATRPCNALPHIVVLHCNTDGGFPVTTR